MDLNVILQNLQGNKKAAIDKANDLTGQLQSANVLISEYNGAIQIINQLIKDSAAEATPVTETPVEQVPVTDQPT